MVESYHGLPIADLGTCLPEVLGRVLQNKNLPSPVRSEDFMGRAEPGRPTSDPDYNLDDVSQSIKFSNTQAVP